MSGLLPRSLWDESEASITDATIKPQIQQLTQALDAYRQAATQAVQNFKLPKPADLFGGAAPSAIPTSAQAQPSQSPSTLPHPSDLFGTEPPAALQAASGVPQATPSSASASSDNLPAAARSIPTAARAVTATVPTQDVGEIDNSSRESFARTAYPHALRAAGGDVNRANQQLAIAISENGDIGTGKDLASLGYNFSGVHAQPGEPSFMSTDAGRPTAFRAYTDPAEGLDGFFSFLRANPRYAPALARYQQTGDIDELTAAANAAGYSETPDWQDRIAAIRRQQVEPITAGLAGAASPTAAAPTAAGFPSSSPAAAASSRVAAAGAYTAGEYTPNQINAATSEGLDYETALAVCGPAAAIAFARKTGRNPTMQEAVGLAQQVGWTVGAGMAGPGSEQRLLQNMGVAARLVDGAPDWGAVGADIQRGNPVIISTPRHYFVAERYDPASGQFDFGNSAAVLKASGGRRWFKPEELSSLGMGEPRASLYMDSPQSPSPSVVAGSSAPTADASQPADSPTPSDGGGPPTAAGSAATQDAYKLSDTMPSDEPTMSPGDQKRAKLGLLQASDSGQEPNRPVPGGPITEGPPPDNAGGYNDPHLGFPLDRHRPWTPDAEGIDRTNDLLQPRDSQGNPLPLGPLPPNNGQVGYDDQGNPHWVGGTNYQEYIRERSAGQMYRQPLQATGGPDSSTGQEYDPRDADQGAHESGYTDAGGGDGALTAGSVPSGNREAANSLTPATAIQPVTATPSPADDPGGAQFAAQDAYSAPQQEPFTPPPGLQAVYDAGGRFLHWIQGQAQGAADTVNQGLASARNAAAAIDQVDASPTLGAGQDLSDPLAPGAGLDQRYTVSSPVTRALNTPITAPERRPYAPYDPSLPPEENARRQHGGELAQDVGAIPYQAAEAVRSTIVDAATSFANAIRAGQEGRPLAAAGNALWAALQVEPHMAGFLVAQRTIDEMLPEARIAGVGPGAMVGLESLIGDGIKGVNALKNAPGRLLSPDNLARADEAVTGAGSAVRRVARGLGEEGARQLMDLTPQARIVPRGEARRIPGNVRMPSESGFQQAVDNTPGAFAGPDGLEVDLTRYQKPDQAGQPAMRSSVHYGTPAFGDRYFRYPESDSPIGGSQRVEGSTIFQRPLAVPGIDTWIAPQAYGRLVGDESLGWKPFYDLNGAINERLNGDLSAESWRRAVQGALADRGVTDVDVDALITGARRAKPSNPAGPIQQAAFEALVADTARKAGHDGIVGYRPGEALGEIIDLRESTYPTPDGGYTLRPEFQPAQSPTIGTRIRGALDAAPERVPAPGEIQAGSGVVPRETPRGRPTSPATRTPPPEGYAAPGELTQATRETLPNRDLFESNGWRVNETEGNLGYMPPGGTKPEAIAARMRVWDQIEPNPRIPPGLENPDMEHFLDDLARLRNGLLTGETMPESQVLGSLLAIASVNRGGTSYAKTLRTLSATTGRNAEELAARIKPDVYYQRGGTGQQQGINIRPEIIWSMIAGDTTDPTMMRMLTAIARPDSFANPVARQRAVTQGVEELYRRLRGGKSPLGGDKVAETIHGDFGNPQAILGYPTQRTSKKTGEVKMLAGGTPWHGTEPERIREMGQIAKAMAGQAEAGSPYAGLSGEDLRLAAIERLLERAPSGIGPTKTRFTASMTALPEYATLDTRMLRDVFGISPAASTLLSVPEYELLSSKLKDLGSNTKYLYGQQWLPWEFLTGEKTTYNSLSGIYDNINRFMGEAEAAARSTGRPIGDVVGELAQREARLNVELADPAHVQARVGLAFRELKNSATDARGSEALIQGLQPGEANKGALEKAFPELFKIADDAGLTIDGPPGVGIGGWKSDDTGKYYLDRTFDLSVTGPKPAVRWFASAMMMGLPKEEAALLTYRGAGAKLDDHIGSLSVKGMTRPQMEEWSTALSDAFPGWSISAKPRTVQGQRLFDIDIMSGAKTEFGGTGHDLEAQMTALAERMQADGHMVQFNGIEPAEMEFLERADVEGVVRGGPRGATVVPERGVAADSAAQGNAGAAGGLRAADGGQAGRGEQAAALGSNPVRGQAPQEGLGEAAGAGAIPSISPGIRNAAFNAAQGGVVGAVGADQQAQAEGRDSATPGERLAYGAAGAGLVMAAGNRGARDAVGWALGSGFVPRGQTVEVLQQRLAQARGIVDRVIESGDPKRIAQAQEARAAIESQLVDAQNARRSLEPRIASDVGRRESSIPPNAQTVENRMDAIQPPRDGRMRPEDLSGPVGIPVDNPQMRLGSGVVPAEEPRYDPRLSQEPVLPGFEEQAPRTQPTVRGEPGDAAAQQEMRTGGSALPGMAAQAADRFAPIREAAMPADAVRAQQEMRGGGGALPGMERLAADRFAPVRDAADPGDAAAQREMRTGGAGALFDTNALIPDIARGPTDPHPSDWSASPVDHAVLAAQQAARAAAKAVQDGTASLPPLPPAGASWWRRTSMENARRMAETGQEPLSPVRWLNRLAQSTVYSALIGPSSAVANFGANLAMPILSTPRELVRPIARAAQTGNVDALREYPTAAWALTTDLMDVGKGMVDALAARGRFAQNPNHPMLSGQTINPLGQKVAEGLELGNRAYSALPDAIFGTLATNFGERRAAAQMATDLGLHGGDWGAISQGLIQDARTARSGGSFAGPTTGELVAALKQADEQGLKGADRQRQVGAWLQQAADTRNGELVHNPDIANAIVQRGQEILDGIGEAGKAYGDHQTFRDHLGEIGKAARTASGADLPVVGPAITPFFNTNWNVWKRLGEHTPLGPALNRSRPTYDKAFDAAFGTLVLAGIANYGTSGVVTGSGPSDPQARKDLESQGWQRYSTLVDGAYVPNRLLYGIMEGPMNMAGDWHDHVAYQKPADAWSQKAFEDMASRVGQQIRNAPTLTGWANVLDAMSGQGLAGKLERYASGQVTSHIPYASTARAIGTSQDTAERTIERGKDVPPDVTMGQQIASGIGVRSGLPVNQDSLGRPKENQQSGLWAFVPKASTERLDPTIRAFTDAGMTVPAPPDAVDGVKLSPAQQRRYQEVMGRELQRLAAPSINGGNWKTMPTETKKILLEAFGSTARTLADVAVSGEGGQVFNDARTKAIIDKALGR